MSLSSPSSDLSLNFVRYRDTRAAILDPCIQGIFFANMAFHLTFFRIDPKHVESKPAKWSIFYHNILTPFQCMLVTVIIMMKKHGKDIFSQLKKNGIGIENMPRFLIPPCVPRNSSDMGSHKPVGQPPIRPRDGFEIFGACPPRVQLCPSGPQNNPTQELEMVGACSRLDCCPSTSKKNPTLQTESVQQQEPKMNKIELEDLEMANQEAVENQPPVHLVEPTSNVTKFEELEQGSEAQLSESSSTKTQESSALSLDSEQDTSNGKNLNVEIQIQVELKNSKPRKPNPKYSRHHISSTSSNDSIGSVQNQKLATVEIL